MIIQCNMWGWRERERERRGLIIIIMELTSSVMGSVHVISCHKSSGVKCL